MSKNDLFSPAIAGVHALGLIQHLAGEMFEKPFAKLDAADRRTVLSAARIASNMQITGAVADLARRIDANHEEAMKGRAELAVIAGNAQADVARTTINAVREMVDATTEAAVKGLQTSAVEIVHGLGFAINEALQIEREDAADLHAEAAAEAETARQKPGLKLVTENGEKTDAGNNLTGGQNFDDGTPNA